MNKTVMFVTFAIIAGIGLVGALILAIYRPEASATFTVLITVLLGVIVSAAGTFAAIGANAKEQANTLGIIKANTNGNLSAKEAENRRLTDIIIGLGGSAELAGSGKHSTPEVLIRD